MTTMTVEEILAGVSPGRMQSVGSMAVIPLLSEESEQDTTFAPLDDLHVGTSNYGSVDLENQADRPTIVPPGAGWVVKQAAQDHAVGSGVLMRAKSKTTVDTARCIQQSQGGTISKAAHDMLILPASLRTKALALRRESGYNKLWPSIDEFNRSLGVSGGAHLEYFLKEFKGELDTFVAQFELVPNQVGALILINGKTVGIERAPSEEFWKSLWEPLVRVCYGSLAIRAAKMGANGLPPAYRVPLQVEADPVTGIKSLAGIRAALAAASDKIDELTTETMEAVKAKQLQPGPSNDGSLGDAVLITLASPELAGQVVRKGDKTPYVSLCAAGA